MGPTNKEFESCVVFWNQLHPAPSLIEVKPSWINASFQGLFAKEFIRKGEVVCRYHGRKLKTVEALRSTDKSFLMRIGNQVYVDAKDQYDCLARYINDCRNIVGYNVTFDKRPEEACAYVIATRDIMVGEEIFADYGRWYWLSLSPSRLTFAALLTLRGLVP